jgi:hypothetical protein
VHGSLEQPQKHAYAAKDGSLSLFHALGKLLYNKRSANGATGGAGQQQEEEEQRGAGWRAGQAWLQAHLHGSGVGRGGRQPAVAPHAAPQRAPWCCRRPMEFDPEAVLGAARLEAGMVAAFLHENLHNFVEEEAVGDMATCMDYLSQSDVLERGGAGGQRGVGGGVDGAAASDDTGASAGLADAAAGSVAARGVCFCNTHPAPRRWLPLSPPTLFMVRSAAARNREALVRGGTAVEWGRAGGTLEPVGRVAAELLPLVRLLSAAAAGRRDGAALARLQPAEWARVWRGQLYAAGHGGEWVGGARVVEVQGSGVNTLGSDGDIEDAIENDSGTDDWYDYT